MKRSRRKRAVPVPLSAKEIVHRQGEGKGTNRWGAARPCRRPAFRTTDRKRGPSSGERRLPGKGGPKHTTFKEAGGPILVPVDYFIAVREKKYKLTSGIAERTVRTATSKKAVPPSPETPTAHREIPAFGIVLGLWGEGEESSTQPTKEGRRKKKIAIKKTND